MFRRRLTKQYMSDIISIEREVFALADESGRARIDTVSTIRPQEVDGVKVLTGVEVRTVRIVSRSPETQTVRAEDGNEFPNDYEALMSESAGKSYGFNE